MTSSVLLCISGIELPEDRTLRLSHSFITHNSVTFKQSEASDIGLPNATLFRSPRGPDGRFKEATRYLLGFELGNNRKIDTNLARNFGEAEVFTLRLLTKSTIRLSLAVFSHENLSVILAKGCHSIAPFAYPKHKTVILTECDCEQIEAQQQFLSPVIDLQVPINQFVSASNTSNIIQGALEYLECIEGLTTPDHAEERGRSKIVAKYGALLASIIDIEETMFARLLTDAYKHRKAIRHGEQDIQRYTGANIWFSQHAEELAVICKRCFSVFYLFETMVYYITSNG